MNEYECKPGAEPGTFILSITFPRVLMVNDGVRKYPCTGIRGFYRARKIGYTPLPSDMYNLRWSVDYDEEHMLRAIEDLEAMIVQEEN